MKSFFWLQINEFLLAFLVHRTPRTLFEGCGATRDDSLPQTVSNCSLSF